MFPHLGFVDTARVFGPASYGAGSPYKGFANQFAAMPSLHFGWALVIAWAVIVAAGSTAAGGTSCSRHPVVTLAAIVLTANHYWLDAVAAMFLFGVALGRRPPDRTASGPTRAQDGGRRNCRASAAKCSIVERLTFHVPSSSHGVRRQQAAVRVPPTSRCPRLTSASSPRDRTLRPVTRRLGWSPPSSVPTAARRG